MYNDLGIDRAVTEIKKQKAKTVCIQLPDGLKPRAKEIADKIQKETNARVMLWAGSCFGACDLPEVKADLLIQWGHSKFR